MNDVFISYSRRNKDFTKKLYDALIAAKRTAWADWDSIPAASDWFAEIKQGIEQTNSVLFVLSPEWIKSNECRKELAHAIAMGKRLLPILYQTVDPNDVPPELAKINWVYMRDTDNFESAFQTLLSAMDTDLDWIKTHTRIQVRALEWDTKNREKSFVLRGKDLADGEQFITGATGKTPEVTPLQGEYILVSRKDATRRQRITMAGVVTALIVSIALGVVAFFQREAAVAAQERAEIAQARAEEEQAKAEVAQLRAEAETRIANSGKLSLESENSLEKYPQRATLLALEAIKVNQDENEPIRTDAEEALRLALQNMTGIGLTGFEHEVSVVQFTKDGRWLVAGTNAIKGEIRIWNIEKTLTDSTYQPFYLEFPVTLNPTVIYGESELYLPKVYVSSQTNWLVLAGEDETKLYQIDDEDEAREAIVFSGEIEFTNLEDDNFVFENQGDKVVYWQIDPETLTKKEVATFNGSLVSFSPDRSFLITDDPDQGLLLWDFAKLSPQPTLLTTKHTNDFYYSIISPTNEWLILFENKPREEFQIPKYNPEPPYDQIGTVAWNSTTLTLIPLLQNKKQEFPVELDYQLDTAIFKPKFSEDGKSFAYIGSGSPDAFGSPISSAVGVLRFDGLEFTNIFYQTKTENFYQVSFVKNNWLYAEIYEFSSATNVGKFFDLREEDLIANAVISTLLILDDNGNVTFTEDDQYLINQSGDLINYYQLDFNQSISIEPALPSSEEQTSNSLAIELNNQYTKLGMENYATQTSQSEDGAWFAAGGFDGSMRLWNNQNPREDNSINLNASPNYIALSNDNQWLAINGTLWKLENGVPKTAYEFDNTLSEYGFSTNWLSVFSPDSRWLVYLNATGDDVKFNINVVDLSKVQEGQKISATKISKVDSNYSTIQFSQNSQWVIIGADIPYYAENPQTDSFAYNLETNTHYPIPTLSMPFQSSIFAFTDDGKHLVMAISETEAYNTIWKSVEAWSLPQQANQKLEKVGELSITDNPIISQNGQWLVTYPTISLDAITSEAKLWNLNCIITKTECTSFTISANGVSFTPNSAYLATYHYGEIDSNNAQPTINEIWDLQNETPEKIYTSQAQNYLFTPSLSKTGEVILFTKPAASVYVFPSMKTAGLFSTWAGYATIGPVITTFDGFGHIIFGGGGGGGQAIGGYQADYSVEAFQSESRSALKLRGHESNISMSQPSPNEKFVLTFSGNVKDDNGAPEMLLRLWDIEKMRLDPTGKPVVLPLQLDRTLGGDLQALAFSPNSEWVYVIDNSNVLHFYPIDIAVLQARACESVGRNLTLSEWERFFPNIEYRKTCANLPEHPSAIK